MLSWKEPLGGYLPPSDTAKILKKTVTNQYHNRLYSIKPDIVLKIREDFDEIYKRDLPPVIKSCKGEHEATYKELSEYRLTHYGSKKNTRKCVISGLLLGEWGSIMGQGITYLNIPEFLTVDEIKKGFEGIDIVVENIRTFLGNKYGVTLPGPMFPDKYMWLIFEKEKWLDSFDLSWMIKRRITEESREVLKWDLITLYRADIRALKALPDLLNRIKETKKGKMATSFDHLFILCELYLLKRLEREIVEREFSDVFAKIGKENVDVVELIKIKSDTALMKIWGIRPRTFYRKLKEIKEIDKADSR